MNEMIQNLYEKFITYSKSDDLTSFENELKGNLKKIDLFENKYQKLIFVNLHQILFNICKYQNIETNIFKAVENNDIKSVLIFTKITKMVNPF